MRIHSRSSKQHLVVIAFLIIPVFLFQSVLMAGKNNSKKPGVHQFHSPMRLAFSPEGNLFVSDYQLGMILTVNSKTLEPRQWFQVQGRPLGVAYYKGMIYVGNVSRKRVEVYSRGGKLQKTLDSAAGELTQPTDIAVDETTGDIFVVDGGSKSVKRFNAKGKFVCSIPGADPEALINPTGIALDTQTKEVIVSDFGDGGYVYPRLQVFDYQGNVLYTVSGKQGMFGLRFSRPQGLAVDENGHIFMVESYSGEIMVFDRYTGELLKTMAGYGTEPGQLRLPLDIVLDPESKDLYVTNSRCLRIEYFEKGGIL